MNINGSIVLEKSIEKQAVPVAQQDRAPAIKKSDLLVINKIDLAPYLNVDLETMKEDVTEARNGLPFIFGEMKNNNGIEKISDFLYNHGGL